MAHQFVPGVGHALDENVLPLYGVVGAFKVSRLPGNGGWHFLEQDHTQIWILECHLRTGCRHSRPNVVHFDLRFYEVGHQNFARQNSLLPKIFEQSFCLVRILQYIRFRSDYNHRHRRSRRER